MKNVKGILASAAIIASFGVYAEQPTASESVGRHQLGGFVNYVDGDDEKKPAKIDDGTGLGGLWGYRFNEQFGARLRYEHLDMDRKNGSDTNGHNAGADVQYYPWANTYVAAGLRHIDMNDDHVAANLGLGHHFFINKSWSISPEANLIQVLDESHTSWEVGVGLNYFFGGSNTSTSSEAQKDSDGDGIFDSDDQCPNTPAGYPVDHMGCPLDSDADGVPDGADACPDTPTTHKVDSEGCSVMEEESVSIHLKVNFANNSVAVPEDAFSQIEEVADFMRQYSNTKVEIQGHTSASGNADYNKQLSQQRADAVAKVLVESYDIDATRVTAVGYGEEQLLDTSNTAEAATLNRRVEALIQTVNVTNVER